MSPQRHYFTRGDVVDECCAKDLDKLWRVISYDKTSQQSQFVRDRRKTVGLTHSHIARGYPYSIHGIYWDNGFLLSNILELFHGILRMTRVDYFNSVNMTVTN